MSPNRSQCQTRLIEQVRSNTSEVTEFFNKIEKELDSNILFKNVEIKKDQVLPTPLNTIEDLEQFKVQQFSKTKFKILVS
jgi:hypothetical protein